MLFAHPSSIIEAIRGKLNPEMKTRGLTFVLLSLSADAFQRTQGPVNARSLRVSQRHALPSPPSVPRPSPSELVSSLPIAQQQGALALISGTLFAGTTGVVYMLDGLHDISPWLFDVFFRSCPVVLGLVFTAAGATHFTNNKDYIAIMPPRGTWGFFELPYPDNKVYSYEAFHVAWTGIAEVLGGVGLLSGSVGLVDPSPVAALLFALTVAVTPANVYMFTHDAQMGTLPAIPYPSGHVFRGAMQCILLGILWEVASR